MATISDFIDGTVGSRFNIIEHIEGRVQEAVRELDFSLRNVSSADVVQALTIPNGATLYDVRTEVVTAEGGVATANIGDTADPNGWDDAANFNSTGFNATVKGTDPYALGRRLSAEGTIDIVPDNDLDTAVVRVYALYGLDQIDV